MARPMTDHGGAASPRTEGQTCNAGWHAYEHAEGERCPVCKGRYWTLRAEAAQEAPAPEGLRDRIEEVIRQANIAGNISVAKLRAALAATPPTPAEPPRCRFPRWDAVDQMWVCCHGGTNCGGCAAFPGNCKRAEARPPEGLDAAWAEVKAALPHGGFYVSLTETYRGWTATARPRIGKPITESKMPTGRVALHRLAARLSAGGATKP